MHDTVTPQSQTELPAHEAFSSVLAVPAFPRRVTVELTNHCNLNCTMCPRRYMTMPGGFMSVSLFTRIIDEMAAHPGTVLVPFFRGESLLHPEFTAMIAYAKPRVGSVQLATNATLMNRAIAEALIDLEVDFVSFSIDSADPEIYGRVRRNADLGDVLRNIEYLCTMKQERNAKKPQIQVSVVETDDTAEGVEAFIRFWSGKVDRVRVYREHSRDGHFGALGGEREERPSKSRKPCLKPFNDLVVYWNGEVALCNHDWNRTAPLGNVHDRSIQEIWRSDAYELQRRAQIGMGEMEDLCRGCDHWEAYWRKDQLIGVLYENDFQD